MKYKTLKEFREAANKRALAHYHGLKNDPEKYAAYLEKRRKYNKERYRKMLEKLKQDDTISS